MKTLMVVAAVLLGMDNTVESPKGREQYSGVHMVTWEESNLPPYPPMFSIEKVRVTPLPPLPSEAPPRRLKGAKEAAALENALIMSWVQEPGLVVSPFQRSSTLIYVDPVEKVITVSREGAKFEFAVVCPQESVIRVEMRGEKGATYELQWRGSMDEAWVGSNVRWVASTNRIFYYAVTPTNTVFYRLYRHSG